MNRFGSVLIIVLLLNACRPLNDQFSENAAAVYNVRLSAEYLQQGNIERAQQKILTALRQAPDWPPALGGMALFLAATGETETSRKLLS